MKTNAGHCNVAKRVPWLPGTGGDKVMGRQRELDRLYALVSRAGTKIRSRRAEQLKTMSDAFQGRRVDRKNRWVDGRPFHSNEGRGERRTADPRKKDVAAGRSCEFPPLRLMACVPWIVTIPKLKKDIRLALLGTRWEQAGPQLSWALEPACGSEYARRSDLVRGKRQVDFVRTDGVKRR